VVQRGARACDAAGRQQLEAATSDTIWGAHAAWQPRATHRGLLCGRGSSRSLCIRRPIRYCGGRDWWAADRQRARDWRTADRQRRHKWWIAAQEGWNQDTVDSKDGRHGQGLPVGGPTACSRCPCPSIADARSQPRARARASPSHAKARGLPHLDTGRIGADAPKLSDQGRLEPLATRRGPAAKGGHWGVSGTRGAQQPGGLAHARSRPRRRRSGPLVVDALEPHTARLAAHAPSRPGM
jgi:hypothetical protein